MSKDVAQTRFHFDPPKLTNQKVVKAQPIGNQNQNENPPQELLLFARSYVLSLKLIPMTRIRPFSKNIVRDQLNGTASPYTGTRTTVRGITFRIFSGHPSGHLKEGVR